MLVMRPSWPQLPARDRPAPPAVDRRRVGRRRGIRRVLAHPSRSA
ncbi:hypothetical protein FM106_07900 [Brachybacterium faecium]|nr:hypothetical protein FM106_07900 [Brachybacterium faecium]